jgi:hypothetical protein
MPCTTPAKLDRFDYCVYEENKQHGRHVIALAFTDCVVNSGFELSKVNLSLKSLCRRRMTST